MPDPLVDLLKSIRKAHGISQEAIEDCMELPDGTYRHFERGRRKLPDYRSGLTAWIKKFEDCVTASSKERRQILELLSHEIVDQFSDLLDDLQRNDGQKSRQ